MITTRLAGISTWLSPLDTSGAGAESRVAYGCSARQTHSGDVNSRVEQVVPWTAEVGLVLTLGDELDAAQNAAAPGMVALGERWPQPIRATDQALHRRSPAGAGVCLSEPGAPAEVGAQHTAVPEDIALAAVWPDHAGTHAMTHVLSSLPGLDWRELLAPQAADVAQDELHQATLQLVSKHAGLPCRISSAVVHLFSSNTQHEVQRGCAPALTKRQEVSSLSSVCL